MAISHEILNESDNSLPHMFQCKKQLPFLSIGYRWVREMESEKDMGRLGTWVDGAQLVVIKRQS